MEKRSADFRAVLITGPRRSGKSTFVKHIQGLWGGGTYVTFDTPLEQARFKADPEGFINSLITPAVIDEAQHVPEVFNYLKVVIDKRASAGCDYILTGSRNFQRMHRVSESLAGRILIKELLPFSLGESAGTGVDRIKHNVAKLLSLSNEFELDAKSSGISRNQVSELLARGGYPPVILNHDSKFRSEWLSSYVDTYVQRDVRAVSNVQDLAVFTRFVSLVAGRTAQVINHSELGKDLGINYKTAQHYLSLLETSFLLRSLIPYYKAREEKRLTKKPKGIFTDTGLAMFLAGLHAEGLDRNPLFGALFETLVINEVIKLLAAFGERATYCHFRAGVSAEVDLVLERGKQLIPIEVKCSASPDSAWGTGIKVFREVAKLPKSYPGYVISLASEVRQIAPDVWNVPLGAFC